MATSARETSDETSDVLTGPVTMVKQPHGGALQVGNPGNRGGGRQADAVRAMLLGNLAESAPKLHAKAMASEDDDFLLRYVAVVQARALPTEKEVTVENVRARMKATMQVIREYAPEELANRLAGLIAPIWR